MSDEILKRIERVQSKYSNRKRCVSFSLLNNSANISSLLDYLLDEVATNIDQGIGFLFHCNVSKTYPYYRIFRNIFKDHVDEDNNVFVTPDTISKTLIMSRRLILDKRIKGIMDDTYEYEQTSTRFVSVNNLNFKFKIILDAVSSDRNCILEFKTSRTKNYIDAINKYNYDMQMFMYMNFTKITNYKFIFVNKFIPHNLMFIEDSDEIRKLYNMGECKYNSCISNFVKLISDHNLHSVFHHD